MSFFIFFHGLAGQVVFGQGALQKCFTSWNAEGGKCGATTTHALQHCKIVWWTLHCFSEICSTLSFGAFGNMLAIWGHSPFSSWKRVLRGALASHSFDQFVKQEPSQSNGGVRLCKDSPLTMLSVIIMISLWGSHPNNRTRSLLISFTIHRISLQWLR